MSVTPEETSGPHSETMENAASSGTDESGSSGFASANPSSANPVSANLSSLNLSSANKASVMHGLTINGIELALPTNKPLTQNAFQLNSFSDLIFGGSIVMEAVGFIFVIGCALRALPGSVAQGEVGVGMSAMVVAEWLIMTQSFEEMEMTWAFGLGTQSLCFVVFAVASWIWSPASLPAASYRSWIYIVSIICVCVVAACYYRNGSGLTIAHQ